MSMESHELDDTRVNLEQERDLWIHRGYREIVAVMEYHPNLTPP